jgi:hypothetical protein
LRRFNQTHQTGCAEHVLLPALPARVTGDGTVWWGEAADEPALALQSVAMMARGDARPTEKLKLYRYHVTNRFDARLIGL